MRSPTDARDATPARQGEHLVAWCPPRSPGPWRTGELARHVADLPGAGAQVEDHVALPDEAAGVAAAVVALGRILHSEKGVNTVFSLALGEGDGGTSAMIKDVQFHPVTDRVIHADFVRIAADHVVQIPVHVEIVGVPIGVKDEGGNLEFVLREVQVACLPVNIPAALSADVAEMSIGSVLRVADLPVPDGVTVLADLQAVVCAVHAPRAEVEPTTEEAEGEGVAGETPEGEAAPTDGAAPDKPSE